MTAPSPEREAQVKALAASLAALPSKLMFEEEAGRLYDAGWRIPAPPQPANPVSPETANLLWTAYVNARPYGTEGWREALLAAAPALLRDLAKAVVDARGRIWVDTHAGARSLSEQVALPVESIVRALTPGHAGER